MKSHKSHKSRVHDLTTSHQSLSPALKDLNITSQDLQCISAAIVGSQIALPYAHTRAFIVQIVSELRDGKVDAKKEADLNAAAIRCSTHVMYQLGGKPAFVERQGDPDGLRAIFYGQKNKLHGFKGYIHESIQALKDSQGDSAVSTAPTLPQLWTKYGISPDLDSSKLYALGIHRHNIEAYAQSWNQSKRCTIGTPCSSKSSKRAS